MGKKEKELWRKITGSLKKKGVQEVHRGLTNQLVKQGYDKEDAKLAAKALITKQATNYSVDANGVITVDVTGKRLQPQYYDNGYTAGNVSSLLLIALAGMGIFLIARKG